MKNCGIYGIINHMTHKIYIGKSVDLGNRKKQHYGSLRNGTHTNSFLQLEFNEFHETAFEFQILQYCEKAMLPLLEKHYFCKYKEKVYNLITPPSKENRVAEKEEEIEQIPKTKPSVFSEGGRSEWDSHAVFSRKDLLKFMRYANYYGYSTNSDTFIFNMLLKESLKKQECLKHVAYLVVAKFERDWLRSKAQLIPHKFKPIEFIHHL